MAEAKEHKLPDAENRNSRNIVRICENMTYSGKEAFKRLRTNTMIALPEAPEKKCRVIGVTSAQPSEGKSTVTINLAYSFAELGKAVLLIDGDMRRPTVHSALGAQLSPGLSEFLTGIGDLKSAIVRYKSSSDNTYFDVIPSGEIPYNPSELLNSQLFQKLIDAVSAVYDLVIIDLPPVNAVVDAITASKCTEGLIVVIRENYCPRDVLESCVDQLRYAKANILGFVMNGCVAGTGKRYQYGQKYYYHYGK